MQKRQVRCYRALALGSGDKPHEVFFALPDQGYNTLLFTCVECGALFASNADADGSARQALSRDARCPECATSLGPSLRRYPQSFRMADGSVGTFTVPSTYPADSDSLVIEAWELAFTPQLAPNQRL